MSTWLSTSRLISRGTCPYEPSGSASEGQIGSVLSIIGPTQNTLGPRSRPALISCLSCVMKAIELPVSSTVVTPLYSSESR